MFDPLKIETVLGQWTTVTIYLPQTISPSLPELGEHPFDGVRISCVPVFPRETAARSLPAK
jgi:hypothetical protein